ncbi:hypothetical protein BO94DRAFT_584941 [Aspergillus sclerotioniger CBS 115572]|uniref:Transcription factor domain-containing protein n=1 Tax=Aspergillus sclerotioniger CBS 115572 TaxID=1450535 RepID=A0A317WV63_9EURO|nr:hypothetical protein BO94DRAFT_584941 [Aspergillus sclerotioniger CBS 115572]PWY89701.1 hypothetical protein BO94DRAFT_584941 [Aspergillus sclerotioniger CBS 115572]
MSKVALVCQAARFLGQVLRHVPNESVFHDDSWVHLDRSLQSILAACLDVDSPHYDQFTFFALVALHAPWLFSDGTDAAHTDRAWCAKGIVEITDLVERQCFFGRDPADMSPWELFSHI